MPHPLHLPNLCIGCKHYKAIGYEDGEPPKCAAYPDGIPFSFWTGGLAHIDPDVEGGLAFELLEGYEHVIDIFTAYWLIPVAEDGTETEGAGAPAG